MNLLKNESMENADQDSLPLPQQGVSRLLVVTISGLSLVALVLFAPAGSLVWSLLLLAIMSAAVVMPSVDKASTPLIVWIPVGLVIATGTAVIIALFAAPLNLLVAGSPMGWFCLAVLLGIFFLTAITRRGRVRLVAGYESSAVSGLAWLGLAVAVWLFQPREVWMRSVNTGTDYTRHLSYMREIFEFGGLDYIVREYPRGMHALFATVLAPSGAPNYEEAWVAVEGALWLLLSLLVVAGVATMNSFLRRVGVNRLMRVWVAPFVLNLVFLQSIWVDAIFRSGFLTSMVVGLTIAAVVAVAWDRSFAGSILSIVVLTASCVVVAHSWALIGLALVLPLLFSMILARNRGIPIGYWLGIPVVGGLSAIPVLMTQLQAEYGGIGVVGQVGSSGESSLGSPEWYWLVALVLAIATVVWALKLQKSWSIIWLLVMFGILTTFFATYLLAGDRWPDLSYYPLKTAWLASVLVPPMAVAGGVGLVVFLFRWADARPRPIIRRGTQLLMLTSMVIAVSAVAGWLVGTPSKIGGWINDGAGYVPLQISVNEALEQQGISGDDGDRAVVWGIAPYGAVNDIPGVGSYDWFSSEAVLYRGFNTDIRKDLAPIGDVRTRNAEAICQHLRDNPEILKITGPNPTPGFEWLRDSGCPDSVVRKDEWVIVNIDDRWFVGLQEPNVPYEYPSWEEYTDFKNRNS